jgi:glycosyltransferase involved in cell wall biosynthesis
MRVTFVVQRYGEEILGGAESHARRVAERLTPYFDVGVLTTCALDYATWENVLPPGESVLNGVRVQRFPTLAPRRKDFDRLSARLFGRPHTLDEELEWLYAQGPWSPALLAALAAARDTTDVLIFFTYIYYPTALGLPLVSDKALLVPTAHDEPAIYFNIYRALFHAPRAILYNTEEERAFVEGQFGNGYIPNVVAGLGVDVPEAPEPGRFRQKLGLSGPYFLYLGRIVESKGCDELLHFYRRFSDRYPGAATLVLLGKAEMSLPHMPGLIYGGFVSEQEKFDAIAGATAVIVPSQYESLSMTALESWAIGRPVVTTAQGRVVSGMCRRGNCGLYYRTGDEFVEILHLLLEAPALAERLGLQGQSFVAKAYPWDVVIRKYRERVDYVASHPWAGSPAPST